VGRKLDVQLSVRAASSAAARAAVDALFADAAAHAEWLRGVPGRFIALRSLSGGADEEGMGLLGAAIGPVTSIPRRDLATIFLPAAMKARAVDEIGAFLKAKRDYARFGIPYRRTFLLAGAPGLGKTSLIHALASAFNRDIYQLTIGAKTTDAGLAASLRRLRGPSGTFVVLEDVDALFNTEREIDAARTRHGLSFSGLLNALDGLGAPPGVLVFLTTNHMDRLDPALLRPGRIDTVLQFEPPSAATVGEMVAALLPDVPPAARDALVARVRASPACRGASTAVLQKWLFDHRASGEPPIDALVALCEFFSERAAAAHRQAPSGAHSMFL